MGGEGHGPLRYDLGMGCVLGGGMAWYGLNYPPAQFYRDPAWLGMEWADPGRFGKPTRFPMDPELSFLIHAPQGGWPLVQGVGISGVPALAQAPDLVHGQGLRGWGWGLGVSGFGK